jgi:replicative DNA helicase
MSSLLTRPLQENIITMVSFDDEHCQLIRNSVEVDLYEGLYRDVAERVYAYIDEHGVAPKLHTPDLFDDVLEGKNEERRLEMLAVVEAMYDTYEGINHNYVMGRLEGFVRQQTLKTAVLNAVNLIQIGGDDELDKAADLLKQSANVQMQLFDPGTFLDDTKRSFEFLEFSQSAFKTGIPELDDKSMGPTRKEMLLFIALPKKGKTWWLIHLGKMALKQKLKVCHVSLEMGEERMAGRYYQSFFAAAGRAGTYPAHKFQLDATGMFLDFDLHNYTPKFAYDDPEVRKKLSQHTKKFQSQLANLVIKEFPTRQLTVQQLRAYLETLELRHNFIPDLLIVDYADLLKVDISNPRFSLGAIYQDLRGLAVERNLALCTASQSNKAGNDAKQISDVNVAEDYSKIHTADLVVTYSQTDSEHDHGLARLFISNARNDEDRFAILLSQNYAMGQFKVDSMPFNRVKSDQYWGYVQEDD